jgi:hypothetical protein
MSQSTIEHVRNARQEIEWVAVDGVLRPLSHLYERLIDDYLGDEIEDFELSTSDWMSKK